MKIMNLPTPETETSTHYFYSHCRHFEIASEEWDEIYRTQFTAVFDEDKAVWKASRCECLNAPTRQKSTSTLMRLMCRCAE